MFTQLDRGSGKVLGFRLTGKPHLDDSKTFAPAVEAAIQANGQVRLLAHFEDFSGWDLNAAWDDFAFPVKHFNDLGRIALDGDHKWEVWMARLCQPFATGKVRDFDVSEIDSAWQWVEEGAGIDAAVWRESAQRTLIPTMM